MAINYAALLTEIITDPNAYGYANKILSGAYGELASLLNEVRAEIVIRKGLVQGYNIINAISVADFEALSQIQLTRLMVVCSASGGVDTASDGTRAIMGGLFGVGASRTSLIALGNRSGSRAEQLFGSGTNITHIDLAKAQGRG